MRTKTQSILQLLAVAGTVLVALAVQRLAETPKEFRGTIRFPVVHIGGEGSDAVLVTSTGAFDLFFQSRADWRPRLQRVADKRVVIVGHSRVAHGIERRSYKAIDVVDLTLE